MEKERVIFRREYDPYKKEWGYIAGFPDDPANLGRIGTLSFKVYEEYPRGIGVFGRYMFDCYGEASLDYFLSKKIIHKNDPIVPELLKALEEYTDGKEEFKVCEKIMRR